MSNKECFLYINGQRMSVSEEVYNTYWHYTEKEKYFMNKLKQEKFLCDQEKSRARFLPSREDSFDRLLENDTQFEDISTESMDDSVTKSDLLGRLSSALATLSDEELALIQELFFLEKTEREVSKAHNVAKTTLHREKEKILKKLRKAIGE